ncbi:SLAP domain-containing protein [Lactobacillus sp. ESL0785]|uniref:SLAP domain-containing protein n=1 Tax=Lactobacillus sp. ESL0785 TaxID=2983232 RepID=UPI0023F75C26|nr:DUF1542 domain-containing protein [Lactobacillus sp. ESL0785]WEV71297.1 SLAP domain-containing protein [Lactobacillus sp. ESL0785]
MLGKNNYKEQLGKIDLQSKKDRFSIRKLTVGTASVLLGFTFMGVKGQTVKADAVDPAKTQVEQTNTSANETKPEATADGNSVTSKQEPAAKNTSVKDDVKLDTYANLKSFLKSGTQEKTVSSDNNESTKPVADDSTTAQPTEAATTTDQNPTTNDAPTTSAAETNTTAKEPATNSVTKGQKQTPQAQGLLETLNLATTTESSVNVGSWTGLVAAYNNSNIHEINIINDIQAFTYSLGDIRVATRNLVIKSAVTDPDNPADNPRYTIDFQMYQPRDFNITPNVNVTYENLKIYSQTYFGLMQTSSNTRAIVNFKDIDFIGSQMMYVGAHTEVHFYGTNTAQTVKSYTNSWGTYNTQSTTQQLFQFTNEGGRLIFEDGTQFTGTTYSGNVIEMSNGSTGFDTINGVQLANDNEVIVKTGANVTLNPKGGAMPDSPNSVENSNSANGILIYSGKGLVDIQRGGTININVGGTTDYTGTINNRKAKAINLADSGSNLTVEDGGNLNIVTNGNISDQSKRGPANTLVNIGGNLTVGKKAYFNITGSNMGNFAGTLMNISGTSAITGSDFRIKLTANPGTGKLTLLNPGSGTTITNPDDFLLDRGSNDLANIISTGNFTLNSVRLKQPGETISKAFRTFGFKGNSTGTISTLSNAIEGISPSDEDAAIALINNKNLPTLEFINANEGFLTIDPINENDITIDDDGNEIITGYANEGDAYIAAVMPNNSRVGTVTSPYHKEADQGIKYAAVSAATAETSGDHQGKFKFTVTIPSSQLAGVTSGSVVTLTATKNFVEGDPSLTDSQNPQTAKLYSAAELIPKRQADAAKAINDAATAAKQEINALLGSDPTKAQPYLDAIDEWVTKSTANDPTSTDSVYGTTDNTEITTRRDNAITAINQQVIDAQTENAGAARAIAKQAVAEYAQKANQYLGTTEDEAIKAYVDAANSAIDAATGADINTAVTTAKDNILAEFKTKAQAAVTANTNTNSNEIKNTLALSSAQQTKYDDELQAASSAGLGAIAAADNLDTAGQAYQDAKTNTQKVFDTANTVSALRTYRNDLKTAYPSLADQLDSESATYEDQIDHGTSDLAAGKAALDQIVSAYHSSAKTDLQNAYNTAHDALQSSTNSQVQDALTAAQAKINALDYATSEADLTTKKQEAQDAINKLNALTELQKEADDQKAEYAAMYPISGSSDNQAIVDKINQGIDTALNDAITNVTSDTTTSANLEQVTTAGLVAIDKVGAQEQLNQKLKEIENGLNNLSGLSAEERDNAIQTAKDLLTNSQHTGYGDQVAAATSQSEVSDAVTQGLAAMSALLAEQTIASLRNEAMDQLHTAQNNANAAIDQTSLSAEDKAKAKQDVQDQVDQAASTIGTATTPTAIDTAKTTAETNINNIVSQAHNQNQELQTAQSAAIGELNQAAQEAKAAIDAIPDDQLSSSEKESYKQQVDQKLTAATNNVNAATTPEAVTSAATAGKTEIAQVQAAANLAAAKSQALAELQAAQATNKQKIDALAAANKIDAAKQAQLKGQIDDFYVAAAEKVNADTTSTQIIIDKTAGINAMNGVAVDAEDTADQEIVAAKNDAIDHEGDPIGLNQLAEMVKEHIRNDANLGPDEKLTYESQVDAALNQAKANVTGATTKDQVAIAATNGRDAINQVKDAADLKSAQIAAEKALQAKQTAVIAAINNLDNIDNVGKAALIAKVNNFYTAAVNKVNNPNPATIAQVNTERDTGIDQMQNVLIDAGDLDTTIKEYQDKLDQVAQEAVDRVNAADMTDEDKQAATAAINTARDTAKANVAAKDNLADIKAAEQAGETAILQAENDTILAAAKNTANQAIAAAVANAKSQLDDPSRGMTEPEKAAARQAIDAAAVAANTAINAASNVAGVTSAEDTGKSNIYQVVSLATLEANKRIAKQAIQDAIDAAQFDAAEKTRAESIQTAANTNIDAATSSTEVNNIKELAIAGINNIKTSAELNSAKDDAIAALDKELNGDGTSANLGVLAQISNNNNLTAEEKLTYKAQAEHAYDQAVAAINGAQDANTIAAEKHTGITNINQALVDANLQGKKNAANQELAQTAQETTTAIDALAVSQTKKDELKSLVASELEKAQNNVNAATDEPGVNAALVSGQTAITNIKDHGEDSELIEAASDAKNKLTEHADQLKEDLNQAYQDGKLDHEQYTALTNQVQTALDNAITAINQATTPAEVNQAEATGTTALNAVSAAQAVEEALNNNLQALQTAASQANTAIDQLSGITPEQKQQMKAEVEDERVKAADKVKEAKDSSDPFTNMTNAKNDGVTAIENISNLFADKAEAIKDLQDQAAAAKEHLTTIANNPADANHPFLSSNQLDSAGALIDAALNDAISKINSAADSTALATAEAAGESAITNATLPTELIAEKNQQIAAINAYAAAKDTEISGLDLTDEHKADLQAQVEAARKKAVDKINDVQLPANATTADLATAKTQVENAEKGIATAGETVNFGEAGIDKIVAVAHSAAADQATYEHKQDNIKQLEDYAADAKQKIEQSGLPADKQQKELDAVQTAVDAAKDSILTASDVSAADAELASGKTKLDEITTAAEFAGRQCQALDAVKDEQARLIAIVNKSSLTPEQKEAAISDINTAYDGIKTAILATTNDTELAAAKDGAISKVQDVLNKDNAHSYPWFNHEIENTTDLETSYQGLTLTAEEKAKYSALINDIEAGINGLKSASNLEEAVAAYDQGKTALNKLLAEQKVNAAAQAAKDNVNNIPDDQLSPADKTNLLNQIDQAAATAIAAINGVTQPDGDVAGKEAKINDLSTNAVQDINSYLNQGIDKAKDKAKDKLDETAAAANTAIDNSSLSAAEKDEQKQAVQDALNTAKDKVDGATNASEINDALNNGQTAINNIVAAVTGNPTSGGTTTPPTTSTPKPEDSVGTDQTLLHNAYLYDENGKRVNKVVLKAGSIVKTYGTQEINGQSYFVLKNQGHKYYLAAGNITGIKQKLTRNAYIYNKNGKRIGKTLLKKGAQFTTYGDPVKIGGKQYFIVGAGQYVKAVNFGLTTNTSTPSANVVLAQNEKWIMHDAYLYDDQGKRVGQATLTTSSVVEVVGTTTINGREFAKLTNGYYVVATNIFGQKFSLIHNAYIYNGAGKRANKKALKRGKQVTVYGDAVKIGSKKYYIVGKNQYVKQGNFTVKVVPY